MIIVTGAAGFIASNMISKLNIAGYNDIVIIDDFSIKVKKKNYKNKKYSAEVHRDNFFEFFIKNHKFIQFIFHLGARTDTTEFDKTVLDKLNLNYTKKIWKLCVKFGIPLIYASSAATYGNGEYGYIDNHKIVEKLKPLNPYGVSKNEFDKWALRQERKPYFWAGIKFFNVYGPNEYHKSRMASVVYHAYNQIKKTGKMKLFSSHNSNYKDGEQLRDFIYVKDVTEVLLLLMKYRKKSGIYNLGTGKARTFIDLTKAVFKAMKIKKNISFIDTPKDIRDKYQYYTQAEMKKIRNVYNNLKFTELEKGIFDYINNYLISAKIN